MPITDKRDRDNWYNSIPRTSNVPVPPDNPMLQKDFSADKLKENYIVQGNDTYVKIPTINHRICRREDKEHSKTYIQLITDTFYDPASKQMRNKKVVIGTDVSSLFPGLMLINDNYYDYLDLNGQVINTALRKQIQEDERKAAEKRAKDEQSKRETEQKAKETAERQTHQNKQQSPNKPEPAKGAERTVDEIRESLLEKEKQLDQKLQEAKEGLKQLQEAKETLDSLIEVRRTELQERDDAHIRFLGNILDSYIKTVNEQAKRRPDTFMRQTQIHTINEVLRELRDLFSASAAGEYLHLAEEPREDDLEHHPGTTYGEMAILLQPYDWTVSAYQMNYLYEKAGEGTEK